jgi:hypothetical protein
VPVHQKIPPAIVKKLRRRLQQNIILKEKIAKRIRWALSFFNDRSIDVMIVKGAALDVLVYEQPWYTMMKDVDLIIKPCRTKIPAAEQAAFRTFFHRSGVEYDYFEHHDIVMNGVLPVDFRRIWDDSSAVDFGGQRVWLMSPEDMLISVCINSCRKRFFRLKSLLDIAEIINKYPQLDWVEFSHKVRSYDCQNIVYAALLTAKMGLGCQLPEGVLTNLQVSPTRASIIHFLVHYLREKMTLRTMYPFSGSIVAGRAVNLSLLLPYATYRWYQVGRKVREIYGGWQA